MDIQRQASAQATDAQWWVFHNGQSTGPYAAGHLVGWLTDGSMPPGTLICPVGGTQWQPVAAWPQLTSRLSPAVLASVQQAGRGVADISESAGMRMLLPVGRSPLAIAAGYLGLLSPLLIFAPFALLCGVLAIADIRRDPRKHGMGRAVFGLVMGVVFSLLFLIMILAVAMDSR
ncbi:MAG: DUF4190 domain-containing protein [Planctomycetales bacterium]|nr:DUF4190 domain-containing protein [Planctomycetales bacterium]